MIKYAENDFWKDGSSVMLCALFVLINKLPGNNKFKNMAAKIIFFLLSFTLGSEVFFHERKTCN